MRYYIFSNSWSDELDSYTTNERIAILYMQANQKDRIKMQIFDGSYLAFADHIHLLYGRTISDSFVLGIFQTKGVYKISVITCVNTISTLLYETGCCENDVTELARSCLNIMILCNYVRDDAMKNLLAFIYKNYVRQAVNYGILSEYTIEDARVDPIYVLLSHHYIREVY